MREKEDEAATRNLKPNETKNGHVEIQNDVESFVRCVCVRVCLIETQKKKKIQNKIEKENDDDDHRKKRVVSSESGNSVLCASIELCVRIERLKQNLNEKKHDIKKTRADSKKGNEYKNKKEKGERCRRSLSLE